MYFSKGISSTASTPQILRPAAMGSTMSALPESSLASCSFSRSIFTENTLLFLTAQPSIVVASGIAAGASPSVPAPSRATASRRASSGLCSQIERRVAPVKRRTISRIASSARERFSDCSTCTWADSEVMLSSWRERRSSISLLAACSARTCLFSSPLSREIAEMLLLPAAPLRTRESRTSPSRYTSTRAMATGSGAATRSRLHRPSGSSTVPRLIRPAAAGSPAATTTAEKARLRKA